MVDENALIQRVSGARVSMICAAVTAAVIACFLGIPPAFSLQASRAAMSAGVAHSPGVAQAAGAGHAAGGTLAARGTLAAATTWQLPRNAALLKTAYAAAAPTPGQAVGSAHSEAAANGINDYISVVDRTTGASLAESGSGTQVASESIMKLMLASYYLVLAGGYQYQSADVLANLSYMIRYSDDATADAYFTSAAIPTIAARYGMRSTINATDRVGHWGAIRITAADMTTFLFRAARDPQVGPWLLPVMAAVEPFGSDGFDQSFGMNSLGGTHGSKQGWGNDEFWSAANSVINSVGYTDRYFVAILQNSYSYPDPARGTSTYAARTIAGSRPAPPPPPPAPPAPRNGDFVRLAGTAAVYRLAGGAPIYVSSWAVFGGSQPVRDLTAAQWARLPVLPADGTYVRATGSNEVYRITYGAPVYVANWAHFGGGKPSMVIDAAAVINAGRGGYYSHLRATVPDGAFIISTGNNEVFRIAGGAPVYVSTWAAYGGSKPDEPVDQDAITRAGQAGRWSHLAATPRDGTYLSADGTTAIFRTAGGAPVYVASFTPLDGNKTPVQVDIQAINHGGQAERWAHLRFYPADGTFLTGQPGGRVYRLAGGRATYVPSWAPYGGVRPSVFINQITIDRAGSGGAFDHLLP